jgi:hypothetical protein
VGSGVAVGVAVGDTVTAAAASGVADALASAGGCAFAQAEKANSAETAASAAIKPERIGFPARDVIVGSAHHRAAL